MGTVYKQLTYRISSIPITKGLTYVIAEDPEIKLEWETTTIKKKLYLDVLEKTMGTTLAICHHIGITRGTFYNWINSDADFKSAVYRMKEEVLNDIEETLIKSALEKNIQAAKFILGKKHPDYKKQPKENMETVVHIHHHATPPGEKEDAEINIGLDELFIMSEEKDLSQLTPDGMRTYKKYKQLADFIKWEYGITDEKPKTKEDFEKEKNA